MWGEDGSSGCECKWLKDNQNQDVYKINNFEIGNRTMSKKYLKLIAKTLLTAASFITLEAPHLSYAMDMEKRTLPEKAISSRANAFLDTLERENPHYLLQSTRAQKNTYNRGAVHSDILKGRLLLEDLNSLPKGIGNLENLTTLSIKGEVTAVPDTIGKLKNLKDLSIVSAKLTAVPDAISNLKSLTVLKIHAPLKELFQEIGNLKSLETLYILDTELTSLPERIGELNALKTLDLSSNKKLINLPKGIENLKNTNLKIILSWTPLA
jgi:hypothetical protein